MGPLTSLLVACWFAKAHCTRDGHVFSHHNLQQVHIPIDADWNDDSRVINNARSSHQEFHEVATLRSYQNSSLKTSFYSSSRVYPRFELMHPCSPVEGYLQEKSITTTLRHPEAIGDGDFPQLLITFYSDSLCSAPTHSIIIAEENVITVVSEILPIREGSSDAVSLAAYGPPFYHRNITFQGALRVGEEFLSFLLPRLGDSRAAFCCLCVAVALLISTWAAVKHAYHTVGAASSGVEGSARRVLFPVHPECKLRNLPSPFDTVSKMNYDDYIFSKKDSDVPPFCGVIS
jgi:hypothetical protein